MKYLPLLLLLFLSFSIQAQNVYTVTGKLSQVKEGKIYLMANAAYQDYYGNHRMLDSSLVRDGLFKFSLPYTNTGAREAYAYRLEIWSKELNGVTGVVLLNNKDQHIEIDRVEPYTSPVIADSKVQKEMKQEFEAYFGRLIEKVRNQTWATPGGVSLKEIQAEGDSLLLQYSLARPDSYVALWKLIERFENFGYKDTYAKTFSALNQNIQNSPIGKAFDRRLKISRKTAVGQSFPFMGQLKDASLAQVALNPAALANGAHFVLIDYWFSNCAPCIRQFGGLKEIDSLFGSKIRMVGISVDQTSAIDNWRGVISKYQLPWTHLLDENGTIAMSLLIDRYPSNFLIDKQGLIVKRNIEPQELKNFLDGYFLYDKRELPF